MGGGESTVGSCQGSQICWHHPDVLIQRGLASAAAKSPPRHTSPGFTCALNFKHPLRRVAEPGPGLCGGRGSLQDVREKIEAASSSQNKSGAPSPLRQTWHRLPGPPSPWPCIPNSGPGHPGPPIPVTAVVGVPAPLCSSSLCFPPAFKNLPFPGGETEARKCGDATAAAPVRAGLQGWALCPALHPGQVWIRLRGLHRGRDQLQALQTPRSNPAPKSRLCPGVPVTFERIFICELNWWFFTYVFIYLGDREMLPWKTSRAAAWMLAQLGVQQAPAGIPLPGEKPLASLPASPWAEASAAKKTRQAMCRAWKTLK